MKRGDADKVHDDEGGHGEEDGGAFAHDIVVDLHDGLLNHAGENVLGRVVGSEVEGSHAKGQDNVEEPADDVGEAQGGGDGRGHCHGRVFGLFGNVRRGIVVGHGPGDGQETKQKAKSGRGPARVGLDLGEDVGSGVFVLLHHEEGNAAGKQHNDVNHRIGPRNLGQPCRVKAVDAGVHNGQAGHDADNVALGRRIGEVGADGDGGEKHLRCTIGGRRTTTDLADQVQPA